MQNKLQELTDKLYSEGLSKGKKEAENIKNQAIKEAEEIVAKANQEYKNILVKAKKDAEDFRLKVENEIKMASKQSIATIKQTIEKAVIAEAVDKPVKDTISDKNFLGEIIKAGISAFNPENSDAVSLEVLLPESMKAQLNDFVKENFQGKVKGGLKLSYDKKINSGFVIGKEGSAYHISFTDKDFQELFGQYLKPVVRQFLFSE